MQQPQQPPRPAPAPGGRSGLESSGRSVNKQPLAHALPQAEPDCLPYYFGQISRVQSENYLQNFGILGSFLLRASEANPGDFTLSVREADRIRHNKIQLQTNAYVLTGVSKQFAALSLLMEYFVKHSTMPVFPITPQSISDQQSEPSRPPRPPAAPAAPVIPPQSYPTQQQEPSPPPRPARVPSTGDFQASSGQPSQQSYYPPPQTSHSPQGQAPPPVPRNAKPSADIRRTELPKSMQWARVAGADESDSD